MSEKDYYGSGNFAIKINADNVNLKSNAGSGINVHLDKKQDLSASNVDVNITAKNINIVSNNEIALSGINNNNDQQGENIKIKLNAEKINIAALLKDGQKSAVYLDNSTVDITADELTLDSYYSIQTVGKGAAVSLNSPSENSIITVNSNGKVAMVEGSSLDLNHANFKMGEDQTFSSDGKVDLNDSQIVMNGGQLKANTVKSDKGMSGAIVLNKFNKNGTVSIKDNQVTDLAIVTTGSLNDTYDSAAEAAQALAGTIDVKNPENKGSVTLSGQSGVTSDAFTADAKGNVKTVTKNQALDSFGNFNAMNLVQWRNEVNHLSQRLGDVRDTPSAIGSWARVYGYDSSYRDSVSLDYKATSIQVGSDYRLNNTWLVGGAFSYTNGDGKLSNGTADADTYSLAAYVSGFFDCGAYVDVVGRIGRLSTDITAYSDSSKFTGSYDNTAFGLSTELGYHWKLNDIFFVEPQAELAYGFVKGDDFMASNGAKIEQDNIQTLVGRLGTRIGASFAQGAGTIYAHASVNHDFLGDADFSATAERKRDFTYDLGTTWYSYGVGAQFNTSKNLNFYGVLERSNGTEYQEDYRYSVGVRYNW